MDTGCRVHARVVSVFQRATRDGSKNVQFLKEIRVKGRRFLVELVISACSCRVKGNIAEKSNVAKENLDEVSSSCNLLLGH